MKGVIFDKDLDCGGRAQRRHRFPYDRLLPKATWRFASRRSPKSMVAAQAALGPSMVNNSLSCFGSLFSLLFPLHFELSWHCLTTIISS
jgi:hypothetical protein